MVQQLQSPLSRMDIYEIGEIIATGRRTSLEHKMPKSDEFPNFSGAMVLVADDSAVNLEVAQAALRRLGVEPRLVESGAAAVEAFRTERYDLVLMDGSMPDIDGFEAAQMIRAMEQGECRLRVPIIALTAHVVGTAANAWRTAGMDDVLHKPYTLTKLAACMVRHLRLDQSRVEPVEPVNAREPAVATRLLNPAVLDGLLEMSGGATSIVARVARLYCDHAPARLAELKEAVAQEDFKRVASAAHAIKSMSLNIGAEAVAETRRFL